MNQEESDPASQITPSGRLVRLFVSGLPWGLVLMGALSFVFYFNKKNKPDVQPSQFAAILRRDLNTPDFERYQRILGRDLGERSLRHAENLEAAAAFMESTMGPDNMGHGVVRQEFTAGDKTMENIMVPLMGKAKAEEAVLVLAPLDTTEANAPDEAAPPAALLGIAHSFAGDPQPRTIVFLAAPNGLSTRDDANGCWQAAHHVTISDLKFTQIIALTSGNPPEPFRLPDVWKDVPYTKVTVTAKTTLPDLKEMAADIRKAAQ